MWHESVENPFPRKHRKITMDRPTNMGVSTDINSPIEKTPNYFLSYILTGAQYHFEEGLEEYLLIIFGGPLLHHSYPPKSPKYKSKKYVC